LRPFDVVTSDNGKVSGDFKYGYGIGGFLGFNFNEHVGIQAEVIYNSISQKYSEFDTEKEINLQYYNIPLLLSLNSGKNKPVNFNLVVQQYCGDRYPLRTRQIENQYVCVVRRFVYIVLNACSRLVAIRQAATRCLPFSIAHVCSLVGFM
jgi:hypothetical protein